MFAEGTCKRSKMKHIDCAQEWVRILRDRDILIPVHVNSDENLADIFTKILDISTFTRLRSKIMFSTLLSHLFLSSPLFSAKFRASKT